MSKICIKCGLEKDISMFYKHSQMADGHLNKCIECCKDDAREHGKTEKARLYDRNRPNKAERNEKNKQRLQKLKIENPEKYYAQKTKARQNYRKNHSEKAKAHSLFNDAVRAGKIIKPDYCWLCDKKCEPEAHHSDYSKPYDVIWVCSECHHKLHKNIRLIRSYYQKNQVSNSYE